MQLFKDIFRLFYPNLCTTCTRNLLVDEKILCSFCRHDLPIIITKNLKDNQIIHIFYGSIPIEKAISFLYFRKTGKVRELIHQLKYKGNQEIGVFIANWFGHILKESDAFSKIDYIIPVPLHKKRLKERGYNQLTKFGEKLGEILKIEYNSTFLIRITETKKQAFKQRFERFSNTQTKFKLINKTALKNKRVLLIDDVITTGATLEACCKELLKSEGVKISIATMAFTE